MAKHVLAFDFGLRRIGVASGNYELASSSALQTIRAREGIPDWVELTSLINEWRPVRLIVGLPLNLDGSDSDMTRRARRFARRLHGRFGLAVDLVDERLSSDAAETQMRAVGVNPASRRESVDRLAAKYILDTWLAQQRQSGSAY